MAQGPEIRFGYSFTTPGGHRAATIGFVGAKLTFEVTCAVETASSAT